MEPTCGPERDDSSAPDTKPQRRWLLSRIVMRISIGAQVAPGLTAVAAMIGTTFVKLPPAAGQHAQMAALGSIFWNGAAVFGTLTFIADSFDTFVLGPLSRRWSR